jgi:flagellar protein FlaG
MYDISSIASIVDGRSTVATSEKNVRSVERSAGQGKKAEEGSTRTTDKPEAVKSAVSELNSALESMNVKREFSIEETSKEVVVKIIDSDEKKVIRQIPTEEAVKLSQNIKEMVGLMYDSTS